MADVLARTPARLWARDEESQRLVALLHPVEVAHDTAYFFDYRPYLRPGRGTLHAMRQDHASATALADRGIDAAKNVDISHTCETLDEWLWTISGAEVVHTDRAHVMIASAMLGKQVTWYETTDHKLPGIAAYRTKGLALHRGE